MQHCSICKSGTKKYMSPEENRNMDYERLRRLRKARTWVYVIWLALRRGWAGNGSEDANASITQASSPLVHTGPLTHMQGQRTTSTDMWKFHPLHRFHHLKTRRTILIQKYFPVSSATLRAGLLSHGRNWAGSPGAILTPFLSAHNDLSLQLLYYSNAQILLLCQFNGQCSKTFGALVIIYCC